MLNQLASLFFYARFFRSFSRLGYTRRARTFTAVDFDFRGQRWVVSGATGGIGRAIALGAARAGAEVVALARDPGKLAQLSSEQDAQGRIHAFAADLSSVAATRSAARALAAQGRVDVLVNNVGLMLHAFERTAEGIEAGFATNLLNHFVLTEGLREAGALDADSLVLSMSSGGMYGAKLDIDALQAAEANEHNGLNAYAQHKRAQMELTRWWNRQEGAAPLAHVLHPGWVDTAGVQTALPDFQRWMRRFLRTPEQGADTALWLAAVRPPATDGIWLDRSLHPEHAFALTRGGADADSLVRRLRRVLAGVGRPGAADARAASEPSARGEASHGG